MKLDHCKQHTGSDDDSLNCYRIRHDDGRPASDYEVMSHIDAQAAEIAALRHALESVMAYPEVRQYLGHQVSDVADAALGAAIDGASKEQP